MKLDNSLDLSNSIYVAPVVAVQCVEAMSNLSDFLCRLGFDVAKW